MASQSEEPSVRAPVARVLAYEVATTAIIYGLPPSEQAKLLRDYRRDFQSAADLHRGEEFPHDAYELRYRTDFHLAAAQQTCQLAPHNSYDLACQYLKNVHAAALEGTHTDSDDSLFDSDCESMPPLIPATPSDESSPQAAAESSPQPADVCSGSVPTFVTASALLAGETDVPPASGGWGEGRGWGDGEQAERAWAWAA
ncbi:hypothetical protein B0H13DRAFT_2351304 [Mycena leptocephala]|nr:hypothetical protein B0H13DRAFT_2351304 [Mycena leptocephala]